MKAFAYRAPTDEQDAVKLLKPGALPLAGGTNLLNLMKERILEPDTLVNIKNIKGLDKIQAAGGGLKIGANVTLTALLEHPGLKAYPALAQALETVATPQIRNMATLGGNLCSRPACWYFMREGFSCPKRGSGKTCAAIEGENEQHAIFATDQPCVSVHASSAAPALVALDAKLRIVGPGGARELSVEKFFTLPKEDVTRENVLARDEIVTHVMLGKAAPKSATVVVLHKEAHDWPVGLASVSLTLKGEICESARICLGAVAPIPWRAAAAEAALVGKKISAEAAADAATADARPLSQNAYKVKIAHTAVKRAILKAIGG